MVEELSSVVLTTGEKMDCLIAQPPEERFDQRVLEFLSHKPPNFIFHLREAASGRISGLETRFYLGLLGERIITHIMTVECEGVGILGHVFTDPSHRRKGACKLLMAQQMEDFRRRGGQALYLGTGYDTPPYYIYAGFGFQSITPGSGAMHYFAERDFVSNYFQAGAADVVETEWRHWPLCNVVMEVPEGGLIRNFAYACFGPSSFEGPFCSLMESSSVHPLVTSRMLVSERRSVVGMATLATDARWPSPVYVLDVYTHPHFEERCAQLAVAVPLPPGKVSAYVESTDEARVEALKSCGFSVEGFLRCQMVIGQEVVDVLVLGCEG